jgi:hypothetical protein
MTRLNRKIFQINGWKRERYPIYSEYTKDEFKAFYNSRRTCKIGQRGCFKNYKIYSDRQWLFVNTLENLHLFVALVKSRSNVEMDPILIRHLNKMMNIIGFELVTVTEHMEEYSKSIERLSYRIEVSRSDYRNYITVRVLHFTTSGLGMGFLNLKISSIRQVRILRRLMFNIIENDY